MAVRANISIQTDFFSLSMEINVSPGSDHELRILVCATAISFLLLCMRCGNADSVMCEYKSQNK